MTEKPCLIALLAASCFSSARADGPHADRIEVTGHYGNGVGTSDTASQGYITPRLIAAKPLLRPAEVLEYVPGVIVTQHSGEGKSNQFFLRGFNLDHGTDFATSVAGVPVNMPTHAHGQGYTDLNFLIPELVSRVDYRKGPYYAQEGDFSSAGAAHFHYYDRMKEGLGLVSLGSHRYRRALAANSSALASGDLLYALELVGNDGPWESPSRFGKQNALVRYSLGPASDRHMITALAYEGRWNSTDQIPRRAVDSGQLGRFGAVDPTDGGNSQRYGIAYERRHGHGDSEFQLNVYATRYRLRLYSNFTYFMNDPLNGDQFEQADRRTVMGISPTWFGTGKLWDRDSILKLGLHLRRDSIGTVALYSTAARRRLGTVREDDVRQTGAGAYAEHSLQWTDWLRSIVGVRHDIYRADVRSNIAANSGRTSDRLTSPKLNFVFGPWARTEYFLSMGRGFHSNDARGTQTRVDPATLADADPAPALVRSKGAEVGVRTEWLPNMESSLALWRLALDSELVFVGDAGTTAASRPSARRGVEWSNRYRPRPWQIVDADVSASRARFRHDDPAGHLIPGSIDRVVAFGASVSDLGAWSGTMQMRYFGPRPLVEHGGVRSQSTLLWNLRLGYKAEPNVKLALDVLNLFDRKASDIDYLYGSQLRGEAAPVQDMHFHPVEPRMVRLTLSASFR